jgi:hypothetical protein
MSRRFAWLAALSLALFSAPLGPALAQQAPEEEEELEEPAWTAGRGARGGRDREAIRDAVRRRSGACRREGARQNLRGPELRDSVAICLAEARLACLKRAVEARTGRGAERQDYINRCLGET